MLLDPPFKAGDTVTVIIDRSIDPEGRYVVRGTVWATDTSPETLWVGNEIIARENDVRPWVTVLPAAVAADVAAVEQAATPPTITETPDQLRDRIDAVNDSHEYARALVINRLLASDDPTVLAALDKAITAAEQYYGSESAVSA